MTAHLVLAAVGAKAFYLLMIWLASAIVASELSKRKGYGEMAEVVTTGQRAVPRRALELGYDFRHPELDEALRDALG